VARAPARAAADRSGDIWDHHEPARDDGLDDAIAEAIARTDHVMLPVWTLYESDVPSVYRDHPAHGDLLVGQTRQPLGRRYGRGR
jgi:hypothetical protein